MFLFISLLFAKICLDGPPSSVCLFYLSNAASETGVITTTKEKTASFASACCAAAAAFPGCFQQHVFFVTHPSFKQEKLPLNLRFFLSSCMLPSVVITSLFFSCCGFFFRFLGFFHGIVQHSGAKTVLPVLGSSVHRSSHSCGSLSRIPHRLLIHCKLRGS